jgi:hypothetical protein
VNPTTSQKKQDTNQLIAVAQASMRRGLQIAIRTDPSMPLQNAEQRIAAHPQPK